MELTDLMRSAPQVGAGVERAGVLRVGDEVRFLEALVRSEPA